MWEGVGVELVGLRGGRGREEPDIMVVGIGGHGHEGPDIIVVGWVIIVIR